MLCTCNKTKIPELWCFPSTFLCYSLFNPLVYKVVLIITTVYINFYGKELEPGSIPLIFSGYVDLFNVTQDIESVKN